MGGRQRQADGVGFIVFLFFDLVSSIVLSSLLIVRDRCFFLCYHNFSFVFLPLLVSFLSFRYKV